MNKSQGHNSFATGFLAGIILPVIISTIAVVVLSNDMGARAYIERVLNQNILTHLISVCVFPNVFLFLIFNRFDKLRSSKGVLGATILWAIMVFIIKAAL